MRTWIALGVLALLVGCRVHPVRLKMPAALQDQAPETFRAVFSTTQGDFVVEVHREWAPRGADRFYNLVRSGFYDGARFHRVVEKYLQWGLPGDPALTKAWAATGLADDVVRQSNTRGRVSFAAAGPNTRTVQVYVNRVDNPALDKMGFAPVGEVVAGMEVVQKMYGGYGEGAPRGKGPDQRKIREEGEAYFAREFPQLDRVVRARVEAPKRRWLR
jgi:peptidyl-prolyl cis-trans isomerase A (cyclophilin A)